MAEVETDFILPPIPELLLTPELVQAKGMPQIQAIRQISPQSFELGSISVTGTFTMAVNQSSDPTTAVRLRGSIEKTLSLDKLDITFNPGLSKTGFFKSMVAGLNTDWLIWVDGGSWFRRPDWFHRLIVTISNAQPGSKLGGLGAKLCHVLDTEPTDPRQWFLSAPWAKGKQFRTRSGMEADTGDCIHYLNPGFFVLNREAISACGIPDDRLTDTGLEITIGEQLHQNDYPLKSFDPQMQSVVTQPYSAFTSPKYLWNG